METDTTYNGWKNRQTWNVMLWLDNEENSYRYYRECVGIFKAARPGSKLPAMRAKAIAQNAIGERTPDGISLNGNRIDWKAIAKAEGATK